nr:uncharacterized protein LOC107443412 [Parasteatoda tepidariorum]
MSCLSFGTLFSEYTHPTLPLSTDDCDPLNATSLFNFSSILSTKNSHIPTQTTNKEIFVLYKISFVWYSTIGCILTLVLVFLAVIATGWRKNVIPENSICLSPVTKLWLKQNATLNLDVQNKTEEMQILKLNYSK